MSTEEKQPVAVHCSGCSYSWNTKAEKARCPKCSSSKIIISLTGENYNPESSFIAEKREEKPSPKKPDKTITTPDPQATAKEKKQVIFGDQQGDMQQQFQGFLEGLPEAPEWLVQFIEQGGLYVALSFNSEIWYMEKQEAEYIASSLHLFIKEYLLPGGIGKIPPWAYLPIAVGFYAVPRALLMLAAKMMHKEPEEQQDEGTVDLTGYDQAAAAGEDPFKDRRTVRKPGT